jgi:hypothetical protein
MRKIKTRREGKLAFFRIALAQCLEESKSTKKQPNSRTFLSISDGGSEQLF